MPTTKNLAELLNSKSIVKVCGAFDAMSAKLVEFHGLTLFGQAVLQFQLHMQFLMQAF